MTYEEALAAVIDFFEKKLRQRVQETTSINYDLGLTGIEASQTLLEWEEYFGISLENMDSGRYFWAELKMNFWSNAVNYYTPEQGLPLTISHLALVVQAGYWFEMPLMWCYPFVRLSKSTKNN